MFLQLHECVGTALGAMGPENFLSLLPLDLGVPDLSESNLWMFPILKQYIVGAHLSFFTNSVLPMAVEMKQKSAMVWTSSIIIVACLFKGKGANTSLTFTSGEQILPHSLFLA